MPDLRAMFDRLKATQREYEVVVDAVERVRDGVRAFEIPAPADTSLRDYDMALVQLEPTYVVRRWAEFESALRSYRRHVVGNPDDNIRASDLINRAQGIRDGRQIDAGMRDLVHEVRDYRNSLVREREDIAPAVEIGEARRRLSTCLAKLPVRW